MSAGKILVVDDEPQIRRVMRVILAGENYEVMEARSGEAALLRFREFLPDLVLLDLNMPGMSGLETCRSIRDTSDVPIIVLTIRREEEEKVEALDAGADDYVTKPFGKQELLARIRAALRRSPASATSGPRTLSTVRPRDRFRNTKDPIGEKNRSPDSQRIRPSALPGLARRQTGPPPGTAAGGMGTRLWRPDRLLARLHHPPSKEDRAQSRQASIHPHRTLDRLPVRQLILHFCNLTIFLTARYPFL